MMPAALLLVLSLLQGEFDFGVPQFRLAFHPMLVMGAAGGALVAARVFMGPGAALGAAVVFLAIRGVIALLVGPVLGEPGHVFPLYLAEAAIVELVALRVSVRRPLAFSLWCGALIGTVGLAAEWPWSGVFPIPWPSELLPEGVLLGAGMALAVRRARRLAGRAPDGQGPGPLAGAAARRPWWPPWPSRRWWATG